MAFNLCDSPTPMEKRIIAYLAKEKQSKDNKVATIADVLIDDRIISEEMTKNYTQYLRKVKSKETFNMLLLAFFEADMENFPESLNLFNEFVKKDPTNPIATDIQQFMSLIKVSELKDYSNLEKDLISIIESISSSDNIINLLWRLSGMINATQNLELFQKLVDKAKELYPKEFRLRSFQGWIYKQTEQPENLQKAIDEYQKCIDGLKEGKDNGNFHFQMAATYHNIALCFLLFPEPEINKILGNCDLAAEFDKHTEEFSILPDIENTKAAAYLLVKSKESIKLAQEAIEKSLEIDPDNNESKQLLQKIKLQMISDD